MNVLSARFGADLVLATRQGLEPQSDDSKSPVLPLNERVVILNNL